MSPLTDASPIRRLTHVVALTLAGLVLALAAAAGTARAAGDDPFFRYTGSTPLQSVAPGTVLKTRTVLYHVAGIPLPLKVVQLVYRSTGQLGQPTTNVTSVVKPLLGSPTRVISYQSAYDSLDPGDGPSRAIAGGLTLGSVLPSGETALFAPFLLAGYSVVISDTEGQAADFAAGPEYGRNTLDSIRAAINSPATGLSSNAKVGLLGYSGGAIATDWAAELAPTYAPDVDRRLVGAAMGGVLADPAHNLHYIDGTPLWSGVMGMALVGVSRAFQIDLSPYLNDRGREVFAKLKDASIVNVLGQYPGLTFADLTKPQYATPEQIPDFVRVANQLIMGTGGTPTTPLFIGQGANGELEGTPGTKPGIGRGDGVMIAGDVRTLARGYCDRGVTVKYDQYDLLSHVTSVPVWAPEATAWMLARFAGLPAPQSCGQIAAGNPLDPIPMP